jgi:hypothetical protein
LARPQPQPRTPGQPNEPSCQRDRWPSEPQTLIAGFPSFGDHPNSQIVFGADGRGYINGAVPTNSSVVGPDNGWALTTPTLQDFPGEDIELSGMGTRR